MLGSGTRFLGVLYAGPIFNGVKLTRTPIPIHHADASSPSGAAQMMHLGYVIRSDEVVVLARHAAA